MKTDLTKDQLAAVAKEHTEMIQYKYREAIKQSIEGTRCYLSSNLKSIVTKQSGLEPKVQLEDMSTVYCILRHTDMRNKTAVLSFASYTTPGGGFITGGTSQEDSLCHDSTLYPVLKSFQDTYYKYNRGHTNNGLNGSRMLYSPGIIIDQEGYPITKKVDVISFSAIDFNLFKKHHGDAYRVNQETMADRVKDVFRVATMRGIDTLILGAWGCGSLGQDAYAIAEMMLGALKEYPIKRVFFAIPDKSSDNYQDFWAALDESGYPVPALEDEDSVHHLDFGEKETT